MSAVEAENPERAELAVVRPGEELAWDRLQTYLLANLPELRGPMEVLQFPNGAANLTYRVDFGGHRLVIRRPPFGQLAPGAHDMGREYSVLSRLHVAYPRAPRALLLCEDSNVIGAPFLVSEYRPGVVVWGALPDTMRDQDGAGHRIGLAVVDALADLHRVEPASCGLEQLGRPDGFVERQLRGWTKRWEFVADETLLELGREVADRLATAMPPSSQPAIIHLDFKPDNCQFAPDDPDRVISVFDWDMATLGEPLVDVGLLLGYWPDSSDTDTDTALVVPGLADLGLPTRAEVVERYAQRSGRDVGHVSWYEAFAAWRSAIVLQQLYARYQRGESTDARMAVRGQLVRPCLERARRLLDRNATPARIGASR